MKKQRHHIGTLNEGSLHSKLKDHFKKPGDHLEQKVDGYIVDIVRNSLLIEIQTSHFSSIKKKLLALLKHHKVRLVYPLVREKIIRHIDPVTLKETGKRKSPKKGTAIHIFKELVSIPELINKKGFQIEVVFITEQESRCDDGKGTWRRKGVSIVERRLMKIEESVLFRTKKDFRKLLPKTLPDEFTNKLLSHHLGCSRRIAIQMSYCLKKMGVLKQNGRAGREILYSLA